jgi:hypothetical protein
MQYDYFFSKIKECNYLDFPKRMVIMRRQKESLFWKIQFHSWEEYMSHQEWIENKVLTFYQFTIR